MSIVNIGTVCAMNPGCIRANIRQSWGITLADATKLLFVWNHQTRTDGHGLWVNLYDPRTDVGRYGGNERLAHVRAIEAGTKGEALVGFMENKQWHIDRGEVSSPYRIVALWTDDDGIIWGNLLRLM